MTKSSQPNPNSQLSVPDFQYQMDVSGFVLFEQLVPDELLEKMRIDIPWREKFCLKWQKKNGLDIGMEGAAHHVVGGGDSLEWFLYEFYLDTYIHAYFDGEYILNSYGALNNLPYSNHTYQHAQRFHRDVRTYSKNFHLMINMLVMVDNFTIENGATKVVPGTHRVQQRPSDAFLESNAVQITGKAGSVLLFDSNLWHCAAQNITQMSRMALTLTFTRPFFKQQMDYSRFLGEYYPKNEKMRQLLGYNARVPNGYDEWYQPPEKRMYKPGQG